MSKAIGIDLGTTYSCVAVWENEIAKVIPNDGERTTPSVVSFTDKNRLIGLEAKNLLTKNYTNTIYDTKRLIGRKFSEKTVQDDMKNWPFIVKKDNQVEKIDRPVIEVTYMKEKRTFYPEEISAMILTKLKKAAEDYLNKKVTDAIITVPANFNNSQRQATKDAGKIAGLNVLRIINEPTAAAIAYGLQNKSNKNKNILVFDLGGGTFDVTVLVLGKNEFDVDEKEEKYIHVKATCGDPHLGGEDFDNILLQFCINKLKEFEGIDISNNQKAIRRLKNICENCKKNLSTQIEYTIEIDNIIDGIDFNLTITRGEFEKLCEKLFHSCLPFIDNALNDAKLKKEEIDEVVLVGGSSRIPYIREMIENYFPGKDIKKNLNPDEAVAIGAAYQANIITNKEEGLDHLVVIDVCPLSLGIRIKGDKTHVIIPRNTIIPASKTQIFYTTHDYQKIAGIRVFQGENKSCKLNFELGNFEVIIKQNDKLAGKVKFDVTFHLDVNCILKVTAKEYVEGGKIFEKDNINAKTDRFTEEEIEDMIKNAKLLNDVDLKQQKAIKAKIYLQKLCFEEKDKGNMKGEEILNWIRNNQNASENDYLEKEKELKK